MLFTATTTPKLSTVWIVRFQIRDRFCQCHLSITIDLSRRYFDFQLFLVHNFNDVLAFALTVRSPICPRIIFGQHPGRCHTRGPSFSQHPTSRSLSKFSRTCRTSSCFSLKGTFRSGWTRRSLCTTIRPASPSRSSSCFCRCPCPWCWRTRGRFSTASHLSADDTRTNCLTAAACHDISLHHHAIKDVYFPRTLAPNWAVSCLWSRFRFSHILVI